jgi:hypothetical protein
MTSDSHRLDDEEAAEDAPPLGRLTPPITTRLRAGDRATDLHLETH